MIKRLLSWFRKSGIWIDDDTIRIASLGGITVEHHRTGATIVVLPTSIYDALEPEMERLRHAAALERARVK